MVKSAFAFCLALVMLITYKQVAALFPVIDKGTPLFVALVIITAVFVVGIMAIVLAKRIAGHANVGVIHIGIFTLALVAFWVTVLLTKESNEFLAPYYVYTLITAIVAMVFFAVYAVLAIIFDVRRSRKGR